MLFGLSMTDSVSQRMGNLYTKKFQLFPFDETLQNKECILCIRNIKIINDENFSLTDHVLVF